MPPRHYKGHLSQRERYAIEMLRRHGLSCRAIGNRLARHLSVIAREINRNANSRKTGT